MTDTSTAVRANAVATLVAGTGFSHAKCLLWTFGNWITQTVPQLEFLLAATAGAWLAGMMTCGFFGRRGWWGWLLAVLGGLLATLVGSATAGLMTLSPGDMHLVLLALTFSMASPIAGVWLAMMTLVHLTARVLRTT